MLVAPGGGYGRMIRLNDGHILCTFERNRMSWVTTSTDEGRTWSDPEVAACYEFGAAANPEIIQLANGLLLLMVNERPNDGIHPYAILTYVSTDGGTSWQPHSLVYEAGVTSDIGCWEPAALQLPSGEIQLFFSNEAPYTDTNEQEIAMMRSEDNGLTWGQPHCICFRPGGRDGLSVPLILASGRGIVVTLEDGFREIVDGVRFFTSMHPSIISTSMADNWNQPTVGQDSPYRWRALKHPLPDSVYAGVSYICQFPTGETVLSCQSTEDSPLREMVVYIGDENARGFDGKTFPFPADEGKQSQWNSLFIKNATTVTVISGTTIDGVSGLWAIDGTLVTDTEASQP